MASPLSVEITRHDFGEDFLFGAATAAYQVEGAYDVGGKAMSNWDIFTLTQPDKVLDGDTGCVAINNYHRYKEDLVMMKKMGIEHYRFSISWSRIMPGGHLNAGVSREGIKFYNDLIDFMLSLEIQPFVTLFHFELPECLQLEYGGFLSEKIIQDFVDFADVCFFEFGDRVKFWITLNEPWSYTTSAYVTGTFPPCHGGSGVDTLEGIAPSIASRYSAPPLLRARSNNDNLKTAPTWDSSTEPYTAAHHLICSHAKAVELYRTKYKVAQGGKIGVTNMTTWFKPFDDSSTDDVDAARRALDFMWGWFVEPMVTGDYPKNMRDFVQPPSRLPQFNSYWTKLVKGSFDFIGMNYYTSNFAANDPNSDNPLPYYRDQQVHFSMIDVHGNQIGQQGGTLWEFNAPQGMYDLLSFTQKQYENPDIYITENGWGTQTDNSLTITENLADAMRITYHKEHLQKILEAKTTLKVKVKGYFAWSILDNFEWTSGFTTRFGMVFVDYKNGLARYPKDSAKWYMKFLKTPLLARPKRQVEEKEEQRDGTTKRARNR